MTCLGCGKALDAAGLAPGASLTCPACGKQTPVPSARKPRTALRILLGVGLGVLGLCLVGALVAPLFIRTGVRQRQNECDSNLKSWFTSQRTRQRDMELAFDKLGFKPERGNRYAYFLAPGPMEDRSVEPPRGREGALAIGVDLARHPTLRPITFADLPPDVARIVGLSSPGCTDPATCDATMVCAANFDEDATLDVRSISLHNRKGPDGEMYSAGEPILLVDDMEQ